MLCESLPPFAALAARTVRAAFFLLLSTSCKIQPVVKCNGYPRHFDTPGNLTGVHFEPGSIWPGSDYGLP